MLTQTTQTAALGSISFGAPPTSLVMLVLGGAGRLYGGLIGAAIFMVARDQFSGIAPQFWYLLDRPAADRRRDVPAERHSRRPVATLRSLEAQMSAPANEIALSTRGLGKKFGSLVVASNININLPKGVRYALIGPNGAGKTTLINLMTGMLRARRGPDLARRRGHHVAGAAAAGASRPRAHLPDQHPVPAPQRARSGHARGRGAARLRRAVLEEPRQLQRRDRRGLRYPRAAAARRRLLPQTRELPYGQQRLLEIALALATRPKVLLLDEPAAGVPQEESGDVFEAVAGPLAAI